MNVVLAKTSGTGWKTAGIMTRTRGVTQQEEEMARTASYLRQFCDSTSLHGFNFLSLSNFKVPHTVFWTVIITASIASSAYIMTTHVQEFLAETVSYNLESPTVPLDDVFFPSVTLCNMNSLRKSFIQTLMKDPAINQSITFSKLWKLVDGVYITGGKENLTSLEQSVIHSKVIWQLKYLINIDVLMHDILSSNFNLRHV